jgi:hypothetical protein
MVIDERLVIEAMCAMWAAGDLEGVLSGFSRDVTFGVCGPASASSFLKEGRGRDLLGRRLGDLSAEFDVLRFRPLQIVRDEGAWLHCRVDYQYLHRPTGMDIDGTMRNNCCLIGGRIVRYEVIHDAPRMAAFLDLVRLKTAKA